jgi:hypothetical protein
MLAAGVTFMAPSSLRSSNSIVADGVVEQPSMRGAQVSAEVAGPASPALFAGGAAFLAGAAAVAGAATRKSQRAALSKEGYNPPANLPPQMWYTGGPLAESIWDPLNLMEGKSQEQLLHWRAVELKHGRVAMLACLGWAHVAGGWHFIGDAANGYVRVSDDPLINVTQLPMGGMWQLVFTILVLEWITTYICKPPKEAPWDILGWTPLTVETEAWRLHQLKELNNGRLAMFGILGLIIQDAATGNYGLGFSIEQTGDIPGMGPPPFQMDALYPYAPSN